MAVVSDKIIQQIAIEGDQQVNTALDNIGSKGAKAFDGMAAGANKAARPIAEVAAHLKNVEAAANAFGGQIRNVFERGAGAIGNFGTSVTRMARQFLVLQGATAAVVGGLSAIVLKAADAAGAIQETADSLGVSTKFFQQRSAAALAAGLSEDQFARSLGSLNQFLQQGEKSNRDYSKSQMLVRRQFALGKISMEDMTSQSAELRFQNSLNQTVLERLGIEVAKFADGGVDLENTLDNIAAKVKELGPGFDVTGLAMEVFGTRNRKVVNLLLEGSDGLRKYNKEAERLGLVVAPKLLEAGDKLSDSFGQLNLVIKRNSITILSPLFGPLTKLVEGFSNAIAANRGAMQSWVADIAARAIPIISDILALLSGREQDVQNSWIIDTKNALVEFGTAASQAFTFVKAVIVGLVGALQLLAAGFNSIFGTNISATTIVLVAVFSKLLGVFSLLGSVLGVIVKGILLAVTSFGLLNVIIAALVALIAFQLVKWLLSLDWRAIAQAATNAWNEVIATLQQMWTGIKVIFNAGIEIIKAAWNGLVAFVKFIWDGIVSIITKVVSTIVEAFKAHVDAIVALWNLAAGLVQAAWDSVFSWFSDKLETLIGWFKSAVEWAKKLVAAKGAADSAGATVTRARGGPIYGPGTETSDSILARLSRGEYVINAKSVRQYGLAAMNAINSGRFRMPAFNMGGLVDGLMGAFPVPTPMRFAEGGSVPTRAQQRAIALTLPGGRTFNMSTDEDTASNLLRYATVSNMRSAGRKPGWKV